MKQFFEGPDPALPIEINQIRILIVVGIILIAGFMSADLHVIPAAIHDSYFFTRVGVQIPLCLLFLVASFHSSFKRYYYPLVTFIMVLIAYTNMWFVDLVWHKENISFAYEGTVLYSFFAMFILRLSFKYSVIYAALVSGAFVFLVGHSEVYGDHAFLNVGFVLTSLLVCLIGVLQIEQAQKKLIAANERLTELSKIDPLTELYNRRTYKALFNSLLSLHKRTNGSVCVFIVDLDHFKRYNDHYGHLAGDAIIQQQAKFLKQIFKRDSDVVARYGGEEFIIATFGNDEEYCRGLAQRIIECWHQDPYPHVQSQFGQVTCSVGWYLTNANNIDTEKDIVSKADDAMYQAKRSGRNQFMQHHE
ncbi:GGDEF domain-containing protein [Shewanella maritima]|uniref:diguanylate cyclase n=1 Tax=Shewanella maritima TaxID=2520507 RepID=A0A411PK05_9GAMM|nr:GGDEF domain-containing protein [Shewanella maritima]QBF83824.1 GGDEF domain-containing protein [Shewanella maritima]